MRIIPTRLIRRTVFLCAWLIPVTTFAQQRTDTLHLSIPKAEEIFLQKNLSLLSEQYNIDINKALVQQAKVWDNPVLNTDQNIYDGKFFRHKTENGQYYGQVYVQVQQLIRTAGKIKKQTQLAQDNVQTSEEQFNDVMRNLKYILTTDMNNLGQLQNIAAVYTREISTMQTLSGGMDAMFKLGDISQKENMRIKALLFSLQADYADNINQQLDLQKEIGMLLQLDDKTWVTADASTPIAPAMITALNLASLQDSAIQARPDLRQLKSQNIYQLHNIGYQNALAKPDLTVGAEYDRNNSYVPNYYGLTLSAPLPLFNRNKGNITAAKLAYKQGGVLIEQAQTQVNKDVVTAWQKLDNATRLLTGVGGSMQSNYDTLMQNMLKTYQQRQISLIEFIDFFDAYKDTRVKEEQLIANQRNAAAELNFTTNQVNIRL
jgi:outer membrane protein, heavy metal efflux system